MINKSIERIATDCNGILKIKTKKTELRLKSNVSEILILISQLKSKKILYVIKPSKIFETKSFQPIFDIQSLLKSVEKTKTPQP